MCKTGYATRNIESNVNIILRFYQIILRWRDTEQMSISGETPEKPGYSYVIESLGIKDLGPYTCQAYNGVGQAPSSTTELKVMGPIDTSGVPREEQRFLHYVVDAPTYRPPEVPDRQPNRPYEPPIRTDDPRR